MRKDPEIVTSIAVIIFTVVASIVAIHGFEREDKIVLTFVLAIANILMAGVIAIQTASVKESVVEMKKERMNIEEFKNSLISYLDYLKENLNKQQYILEPKKYILSGYQKRVNTSQLSPSEMGLILRISRFIEIFLGTHGLSWERFEKYNSLNAQFQNSSLGSNKQILETKITEESKRLLEEVKRISKKVEDMGDGELEEEILKLLKLL